MVRVEVFSDVICPWCYIGGRRLERAMRIVEARSRTRFRAHYRAFELNPGMPAAGMERRAYRTAKFGSWKRSQELDAGTATAAADDGITFNYEAMARTPNSRPAHRLIKLAEQRSQLGSAMADRLFSAYFSEGLDVGDPDTLAQLGREVGVDASLGELLLDAGPIDETVEDDVRRAEQLGVRSVPFFIVGRLALPGAVSVDCLVTLLAEHALELPATTPGLDGARGLDSPGCGS